MSQQNLQDVVLRIWGNIVEPPEKLLEGDPGLLDISGNAADLVLRTLKEIATVTPIAHLKELCGGALVILNTIQDVKDNKADFRRLAHDAVGLAFSISQTSKHAQGELPEDLRANLIPLVKTLHDINAFAEHQTKRKRYTRIIFSKADKGKIAEYREILNQSMANFGIKSNISIHQTVVELLEKHDKLVMSIENAISVLGTKEHVDGLHQTVAELVEKNDELLAAIEKRNREEAERAASISNSFGGIKTSSGTVTITNVTGDYSFSDDSVVTTNTNSNNRTTTITRDSNNSGYTKPAKPRGQGNRAKARRV
ncbi:hypothetical protein BDQ12DRAFT_739245 [Crucibulum laeve]|uniref:Uncharacterized protein n=1 Tax=Crucibulum laeve TaxID=68775 RepID=A0A5C3LL80_9AGAR|nr:hypothetical protein BDQ12DRAFT_739245 [Crucibulum laeve]